MSLPDGRIRLCAAYNRLVFAPSVGFLSSCLCKERSMRSLSPTPPHRCWASVWSLALLVLFLAAGRVAADDKELDTAQQTALRSLIRFNPNIGTYLFDGK